MGGLAKSGEATQSKDTKSITEARESCPLSQRVDGKLHSWKFDGDDPYVICAYCKEVRDALTDRIITEGRKS
jgi:hypothetical protein